MTNSFLLNMAIEIVDFPIKHGIFSIVRLFLTNLSKKNKNSYG